MFICTYTHQVKDYCFKEFFDNLEKLAGNNPVYIVDNTPGTEYYNKIVNTVQKMCDNGIKCNSWHLDIDPQPDRTRFLRSVADSANICRDVFLHTSEEYFLIIESDVIPPVNIVELLENDIKQLPENWAALGALYYTGFHDYSVTGIHQCPHTLSGCTVYSRQFIEQFPFEWREDNLGAFSDAWAGINAGSIGMPMYNNHSIHCAHLK